MTTRIARVAPGLRTVVWKDPFAVHVAGHVAGHGVPVLATVRNPWAVAASFKRLGWGFDVAELVGRLSAGGRPVGVDARDLGDAGDLDDLDDPVVNAAVHWRLAHESLLAAGPGVHLVDLDAVIASPEQSFRRLYGLAGLTWTDRVTSAVAATYDAAAAGVSAAPAVDRAHVKERDVSAVNSYWTDLLDDDEVGRVDALCGGTWASVQQRFAVLSDRGGVRRSPGP